MMPRTTIIIPCYNEESRLERDRLLSLVRTNPSLRLLMVNDGSTDGTQAILEALQAAAPSQIVAMALERNSGKAEAVRRGLLRAIAESTAADAVGYADADLATPPEELSRLANLIHEVDADVIIGSRVKLLGRDIERRPSRHYLGRVFATAASLVLQLPVYDTQCGAKFFRVTAPLRAALESPFGSRWVFDVEFIGRLITGTPAQAGMPVERIREEPLLTWRDVPGSKLRPRHMAIAALDLLGIWNQQRRVRRVRAGASRSGR